MLIDVDIYAEFIYTNFLIFGNASKIHFESREHMLPGAKTSPAQVSNLSSMSNCSLLNLEIIIKMLKAMQLRYSYFCTCTNFVFLTNGGYH